MNIVVLLSGGKGTRMKSVEPKQHIVLQKHQIIEYTLSAFATCDMVDLILVVSNKEYVSRITELYPKCSKLRWVIEGGETRIQSVANAVRFLKGHCGDFDKVIISDAVRPCITIQEIENLYQALDTYPAATTGVEIYETILRMENDSIEEIIPRDGIVRQTSPEGYLYSVLRDLYLNESENKILQYRNIGVDQLLAKGEKIGYVKSNPLNFKITTQEDLQIFESVLKRGFDSFIKRR